MAISAVLAVQVAVTASAAHSARKDAKRARQQMEKDAAQRSRELETLLKDEPTMPLPDDDAVRQAARRSRTAASQRAGRASTLLSDTAPTVGLGG